MTKTKSRLLSVLFVALFAVVAMALVLGHSSMQQVHGVNTSITLGYSQPVATRTFVLPDNTSYNIRGHRTAPIHPLGRQMATISVDVLGEGGQVVSGVHNGVNSYAVIAGQAGEGNSVEIKLAYNFDRITNLPNFHGNANELFNVSYDTHHGMVNEVRTGVVGHGALTVEKSFNGTDWDWENPLSSGSMFQGFRTTNFMHHFPPYRFQGLEEDGSDRLVIYVPSGADINRGVFLRVALAYELSFQTYERVRRDNPLGWVGIRQNTRVTRFINVIEVSTFFLSNGSGEVIFTNAFVSTGLDDDEAGLNAQMTQALEQFGTIRDGHASNNGFRLNTIGNLSYRVQFSRNGTHFQDANDGQFFSQTGRYVFRVTDATGRRRETTLFINELGVQNNLNLYFGSNFITQNSQRIFSTADAIPVYLAGSTHWRVNSVSDNHMPIVGKIRNVDTDEIVEIINGYEVLSTDGSVIINGRDDRRAFTGTIHEPGEFEAIFVNNPDHFNGLMSGDAYIFVFRFIVIDSQFNQGPLVNSLMLNYNISFSDFASGYYGVNIPSAGAGDFIFAFSRFFDAFTFAYNHLRSLVVRNPNGTYVFRGTIYNSHFEVLGALHDAANDAVARRHFDPTDPSTFLTISHTLEYLNEINLAYDVVVFSDFLSAQTMIRGEPFLNNRRFSILTEYNTIESGYAPIRFIQVADFETIRVDLIHIETGRRITVPFEAPVEAFLIGQNAPSGRYRIEERNRFDDLTTYYAMFINPNHLSFNLQVDTFLNGMLSSRSLDQRDAGFTVQNANGFVIRGIENRFDNYGLIRIDRAGDPDWTRRYEFGEAIDIIVDQVGTYTVSVIDRVGNTIRFYFTIHAAVSANRLTLLNNGVTYRTFVAFDGQTLTLPTPQPQCDVRVFAGWQVAGGARYNHTITFRYRANITLNAVWLYNHTAINVYDGNRVSVIHTSPEQQVLLPNVSMNGFSLFGWRFIDVQDNTRFFYGQISDVPNVQSMRIDAIWMRNPSAFTPQTGTGNQIHITLVDGNVHNTLVGTRGASLNLPQLEQAGLSFAGWQFETGTLTGLIFSDSIAQLPNQDSMVLTALWLRGENDGAMGGLNIAGTVGAFWSRVGGFLSNVFTLNNTLIIVFLLLGLFALYILLKHFKKTMRQQCQLVGKKPAFAIVTPSAESNSNVSPDRKAEKVTVLAKSYNAVVEDFLQPNGTQASNTETSYVTHVKGKRFKKGVYQSLIQPIICAVLIVVLACFASYQVFDTISQARVNAQIDRLVQESLEDLTSSTPSLSTQEQVRRRERLALATQAFETNTLLQDYVSYDDTPIVALNQQENQYLELTEEQAFVISMVYIDLVQYGYFVFPAIATKQNGVQVRGFAFTDLYEVYEIAGSDRIYFGTGFVSLFGEPVITNAHKYNTVIVESASEPSDEYAFTLTFGLEFTRHYIAHDLYVIYSVNYTTISYIKTENIWSNYNLELGFLFNFDIGRPVYDPYLGQEFTPSAFSTVEYQDYDFILGMLQALMHEQEANGTSVDAVSTFFISEQAINDFIMFGQQESFLGLSVYSLYYIESQLDSTHFYVIMEDGTLEVLEIPPPTPGRAGFWQRFVVAFVAIQITLGAIALGVAISVLTLGTGAKVAMVAAGAVAGAAIEVMMQVTVGGTPLSEVNWGKVGVAAAKGALLAIPGVGFAKFKIKGFAKLGYMALVTGAGSAAKAILDGGSVGEVFLAFGIGAATGAALFLVSKGVGKLAKKITKKIRPNSSLAQAVPDPSNATQSAIKKGGAKLNSTRPQIARVAKPNAFSGKVLTTKKPIVTNATNKTAVNVATDATRQATANAKNKFTQFAQNGGNAFKLVGKNIGDFIKSDTNTPIGMITESFTKELFSIIIDLPGVAITSRITGGILS